MREIRTSGLMSGEGKRSDANAVQTTAPFLDSTEVGVYSYPGLPLMNVAIKPPRARFDYHRRRSALAALGRRAAPAVSFVHSELTYCVKDWVGGGVVPNTAISETPLAEQTLAHIDAGDLDSALSYFEQAMGRWCGAGRCCRPRGPKRR